MEKNHAIKFIEDYDSRGQKKVAEEPKKGTGLKILTSKLLHK